MAKLCPAGKAAAKRKFKVYPSAYANMWASKYCKGKVGKKKQGYKARKDESIAMRIKKKRTKKQLKASRDESYGKFGSAMKKKGKINR